jgi:hypothetical protein
MGELARLCFTRYAWSQIIKKLKRNAEEKEFQGCLKEMEKDIKLILIQNKTIYQKTLFAVIKSAALDISEFGLFIAIRLLGLKEFHNICLRDFSFMFGVLDLWNNRQTHVLYAGNTIFQKLLLEQWRSAFLMALSEFFSDFFRKPSNTLSPLFLENIAMGCALFLLTREVEAAFLAKTEFLLQISSLIIVTPFNPHVALCVSMIIDSVISFAVSFKLLGNTNKGNEIRLDESFLSALSLSISELEHFIPQNPDVVLLARSCLLSALRNALKEEHMLQKFGLQRFCELLLCKIPAFCRDGRSVTFSDQAWRFVYDLIQYHSVMVDIFISQKMFSTLFDILGSTTHRYFVTINSIRYISKILFLSHRAQDLRVTKRTDGKSVEKDIRTIIAFMKDNHMFVKFHMMYKRYIDSKPGGLFTHIARLYHEFKVNAELNKFTKDLSPDYLAGIEKIAMICADLSFTAT